MRKLLHSEFMSKLKDDIAKAKKSVIIISPYITLPAVSNLVDAIPKEQTLERILVTLPFGSEYLTGAVELEALKRLQKSGFSLKSLTNLHSKIYIIDNKIAYIGSANFTGKGWGLVKYGNIEVMTRMLLTEMDTEEIRNKYLNPSNTLELSSELEQAIISGKDFAQSYQQSLAKLNEFVQNEASLDELEDRYYFFLKNLKDQKKIASFVREKNTKQFGMNVFHISNGGSKQSAKLFYSVLHPTKTYKYNYDFELSNTGGGQAKKNRLDCIMILELDEGKDSRYVRIPASFMEKTVLRAEHFNKNTKAWRFSISEDQGKLLIRCSNQKKEKHVFDISEYENKLTLPKK